MADAAGACDNSGRRHVGRAGDAAESEEVEAFWVRYGEQWRRCGRVLRSWASDRLLPVGLSELSGVSMMCAVRRRCRRMRPEIVGDAGEQGVFLFLCLRAGGDAGGGCSPLVG